MRNKLLFILLLFLLSFDLNAQFAKVNKTDLDFDFGFLVEMTELISNQKFNNLNMEKIYTDIYPISLYLSGRVKLYKNLSVEARPGILFGGESFMGLEYGFYFRYYFTASNFFIIGGINIHDNLGDTHGVTKYVESTDDNIALLGIAVGFKMHNNFAFILSFYKPLSDYEYYYQNSYNTNANVAYSLELGYIIKAGFDITF